MTRIKKIREELGLSQGELAKLVGVTRQTVGKWDTGTIPGGEHLAKLQVIFNKPAAYILGESDDPEKDEDLHPKWVQAIQKVRLMGYKPEDVVAILAAVRGAQRSVKEE